MTLSSVRRLALVFGLGALAGAVLPASLRAQVPVRRDTTAGRRDTLPSRADSARAAAQRPPGGPDTLRVPLPPRADSVPRGDTTRAGARRVRADTIKPPLARTPLPPVLEIGPPRIYDRGALFATGALTLSDLLGRVPGLTEFTAGWIGAPSAVAVLGDVRRVRLFLDGIELDPLDPRQRGTPSLYDLPILAVEELRIERGADEVRVHVRTWRVDRTTAYTRADVATGDQNTNLYRAFFGRRFSHGEAFQFAAEQYSTQPTRALPSSDALTLMLRVGTTRGPWSLDGFALRTRRNRAPWVGSGNSAFALDTIAGLEAERTTGYARLANGDPERGPWVQLSASGSHFRLAPRASNDFTSSLGSDTSSVPDTTLSVAQYVATVGTAYGPFRVSATERVRAFTGRVVSTPSARASLEAPLVAASVFAEASSSIAPARVDATVRFTPVSRLALLGSVSRTGSGTFDRMLGDTLFGRTIDTSGAYLPGPLFFYPGYDSLEVGRYRLAPRTSLRAEAGIRIADFWVSGGILRRAATTLFPAPELIADTVVGTSVRTEGEATAGTVAVRGRLFKAVHADAWGIAWNDSTGFYRPRYQSRAELYIQTNLLDRFPKGNFGLLASLAHEYRSSVRFPLPDSTVRTTSDVRTVAFKLEIRIQTAVVSYQFRNLLQQQYQLVPGFFLPRQTQFYGVRWEFWN